MKRIIILIGFLTLVNLKTEAQNPRLNKYTLGEGLTFTSSDGHKMNLRVYAQPYLENSWYEEDSLQGPYTRFRMRRLRFRLSGAAERLKIDYRFQLDLSGTSEAGESSSDYLMDAWVAYNPTRNIKIKFGQSATPTDNLELSMGSHTLQLVERSRLTSAFSTIREFGLFASGRFKTGGGTYLRPHIVVTNGDGINAFSKDHGGLKFGGRLDFLPFGLFTNKGQFRQGDMMRELVPKLLIGANYSLNKGMSSRRGRIGGDIIFLNDSFEESLPDFTKFGVDLLFKYKGFSVLSEFVATQASVPSDISKRVRNNGSIATKFEYEDDNGNTVENVENYVKRGMMLGSAFNVQMGYIFKNLISIDARYTAINADKYSFLNNGAFYNQPKHYTLGITKYFQKSYSFKVQSSITYTEHLEGSRDAFDNGLSGGKWTFRIITSFAL